MTISNTPKSIDCPQCGFGKVSSTLCDDCGYVLTALEYRKLRSTEAVSPTPPTTAMLGGWQLVPKEPAEEMIRSALAIVLPQTFKDELRPHGSTRETEHLISTVRQQYAAMLHASPPASVMQSEGSDAELPQDVVNLVVAARIVAFEDQSPEAIRALDRASEAFASRVPWDDEPDAALQGQST